MHRISVLLCFTALFISFSHAHSPVGAGEVTTDNILEKHFSAVGGKEKIATIKAVSFTSPSQNYENIITHYYATAEGDTKLVYEMNGYVWRVTTRIKEKIETNSPLPVEDQSPVEKLASLVLAKLSSAAFSLYHFGSDLNFIGSKKYGPEQFYLFATKAADHELEFHIDQGSLLIKRAVLKGSDEERGKYELAYDFGDVQDAAGFKIPNKLYRSFIGAGDEGSFNQTIANYSINPELGKDFFSTREIDFGKVTASAEALTGTALYVQSTARGYTVIFTNLTPNNIEKLTLKTMDKLTVKAGKFESDAVYCATGQEITPELTAPGSVILLGSEDFFSVVVGFGDQFNDLNTKIETKSEIVVTKVKSE